MVQNALHIMNRALVMIGVNPIQGLKENSAEATVMNDIYAGVRDGVLSAYAWQFATRMENLSMLSTVHNPVPSNGNTGKYVYALPHDMLRLLKVHSDTYTIRNGALYTNRQGVCIQYIFRPEEIDYPAYFDTAFVSRLAAEVCLPLTDSTTRTDFLYKRAEQELKNARLIDASQLVNSALDMGALTDIR